MFFNQMTFLKLNEYKFFLFFFNFIFPFLKGYKGYEKKV